MNKQKNEVDGNKLKKSHDRTWKFEIEWATKLPWVEDLVAKGGFIHTMKCKVCSLIENKEKFVGCKWDTLTKHQGCRRVK